MPTWKKVVVSGSSISQLNNDSNFLTITSTPNSFATASYSGTNLLADNPTGSLNFASSSGQGLTISATPATDTLTFGLSAIPTSSLLRSGSTIGTTVVNLGETVTTLAGLTSVTATNFTGTASYVTGSIFTGNNLALSASYALTAAFAANVSSMQALTPSPSNGGISMSLSSYNGSSAVSIAVSGASGLTANRVTKWTGNAFANSNISDDGTLVTISSNLRVTGTASFEETTNLLVADRFILLASGSSGVGEGGLVVQQASQGVGELFGWDNDTLRWAVTGAFTATGTSFTPDAFVSLAISSSTVANPNTTSPATRFNKSGNVFTGNDESIWIWS
jgi:hypothetical protein